MDRTDSARCPAHPDAAAVATCGRCGGFVCAQCRRFYDYRPLCSACYERRSHGRPASRRARWSVIFGVLGITLVVIPFGVPAVVLAQMELSAIERGEAPAGGLGYARAGALIGWLANLLFLLIVALGGILLYVSVFALDL